MADLSSIEDMVLPDSDGNEVRLGDLWADQPIVIAWLRHYGWTFCRQFVTQLRDRHEELTAGGARVVAIGMGWPEMAAHFKREFDIPFTLLIDHKKETYRALKLGRANPWNIYGPPVWIEGIRSILSYGNKFPKQDPLQLGGVVVAEKGGKVLFVYRAKASSDIPPIDRVLATL